MRIEEGELRARRRPGLLPARPRARARRSSTATAIRPTARTGCPSWSGEGPALAIDMPGWARSDRPDPPTSTTRCTGSRRSSSAVWTSSAIDAAQAGRPRLGRPGPDRRPAPAGPGRDARGDQLGAAATRLPLALDRRSIWRRRGARRVPQRDHYQAPRWALILRQLAVTAAAMPPEFIEMIWGHLGPGHQRRPSPSTDSRPEIASPPPARARPHRLARHSSFWETNDPFLNPRFARGLRGRLADSQLELVELRRPLALDRRPRRRRSRARFPRLSQAVRPLRAR